MVPLLDGSPDALVHMETLRRAVIYLTPIGKHHEPADVARLIDRLSSRAQAARRQLGGGDLDAGPRVAAALAAFDLAFAVEARAEAEGGGSRGHDTETWLTLAVEAHPDDGGLRLGASILCFARRTMP